RTRATAVAGLDGTKRRYAKTATGKSAAETPDGRRQTPRLVAENIVAGYGNQTVIDKVSVQSHEGITCLFGPNGSGKSTLLKAIAGSVPVISVTVKYGDRAITNLEPHEIVEAGITTLPQDDYLFRNLTVRENLQLGASVIDDKELVRERMAMVLEMFPPLAGSLSLKPPSLSGGQQVMLGVGRAMMTRADVYLMDEPVSGLAPSVIDKVFDKFRTLVNRGTQIILVEQNVVEAMKLADHAYVLAEGQIQFDGHPEELTDEDEIVDLYLGLD
ncbi:MAG: ABC transporter ATP-binding protein, partial [Halobacteriaceae archaeon]